MCAFLVKLKFFTYLGGSSILNARNNLKPVLQRPQRGAFNNGKRELFIFHSDY